MLKRALALAAFVLFAATPCLAQTEGTSMQPSSHTMVSIIHVTDYDRWLAGFNTFESQRETLGGLRNPRFLRGVTDTHIVAILFDVDDVAKARAFMTGQLLLKATDSSGVVGPPIIYFP
jgi:hypothetical protein